MATEIRVPTLGESVAEATVGKWLKQPGEAVKADEPLVELETDKVSVEVPAPFAGSLTEIVAKQGDTVEIGGLLAQFSQASASAPAKAASVAQAAGPSSASSMQEAAEKTAMVSGPSAIEVRSMPPAPAAQKMLAEKNMSVDQVAGSGKRGQVLKSDVVAAASRIGAEPVSGPDASPAPVETPRAAVARSNSTGEERVRMTRLRQTIARRLKEAQNTAAMLTTFNEVDMGAVMELRNRYKELFEKKHGVKLGFMGFFAKAVCHALKEIPAVNAEIDGTDIIYKNYCHVGVAVGTDKGLVVPVVRDADQMGIAGIETEIGRLGKRARDGQLELADMQGGTFTISNGGVYGSLMSTPILNAPQSGILGMHKIQDRPIAVGGQIVIRPMMYLALSYDHRIVDGREAVTFLVRVKESLEDPERLVLDL